MSQHHAAEVKARLLNQLESYLQWLFPNGKVIGHEFRVGSVNGEAGKSLCVQLRGASSGCWCDFATSDQKGDIYSLHQAAKSVNFAEAFAEICAWLGITDIQRPVKKAKPPPPDTSAFGMLKGTPVHAYLRSRGIADETIRAYRVRSHHRPSPHNQHFVGYQFWDSEIADLPDHYPVFVKSTGIALRPDGSKDIWSTTPYYTLWGWWLVKPHHREIVIVEGEIDAMSLWQLLQADGIDLPVLSMPSGASNLTFIENDYDVLQRFERIYLCPDMDDAGNAAAVQMAKRLGVTRCMRVPIPGGFKDANKFLTDASPEMVEAGWPEWMKHATSFDPPTLRGAGSYVEEAKRRINQWELEEEKNTFFLPAVPFAIRNGECTLVTGISGHGKSELVYGAVVNEMKNGHKVCLASFEIDPAEMMTNMGQQFLGRKIRAADMDKIAQWLDGKLWFFDIGEVSMKSNHQALFDNFSYASKRYGCDRFVIDSLLFAVPKDAYEEQDEFCKAIRDFDRRHNTHSFLIAHCSPKNKEHDVPGLGQIQGSGGIVAPFSNILIVWRNIEKEDKLEEAKKDKDTAEIEKLEKVNDGLLVVQKHRRKAKGRSKTKLWFDADSRSFRTTLEIPPKSDNPDLF